MAAITHWVDGVGGNDGNDGKSYANRIATMTQLKTNIDADGNGNDYTINVLNTGTYELTTGTGLVQVDNQTTSTFHFRGVSDSSETPAMVNLASPVTSVSTFFYVREHVSCVYEYFKVDFSPNVGGNAHAFCYARENSNNLEIRYCHFKGGTFGTGLSSTNNDRVVNRQTFVDEAGSVHHCIFENMHDTFVQTVSGAGSTKYQFYFNVIVTDAEDVASAWNGPSFSNATQDMRCYNNTYYAISAATASVKYFTNGWMTVGIGTGAIGRLDNYNNVVWIDEDSTVISVGRFCGGSAAGSSTITTGQLGNNIYYTGPNVNDIGNIENYHGTGPWVPGVDDEYDGDVRVDNAADTVLFADPTITLGWTPTGSSVELTVPMDLRLVAHQTAGVGGAAPGALGAATTDYTATLTTDKANPEVAESVTLTATMANSGTEATTVVATMTGLTGLTFVSATPSQGSYDDATGIWTIGTIADAASASMVLVYTVDAGQEGNSLTPTFTFTSGDLDAGAPTADDTASVTLSVLDTGDPSDPEGSGVVPYLDVLPIYATDLQLDLNMRMSSKKNRLQRHYIRGDIEGRRYREFSTKRIVLATNTTMQVSLGGIQRGDFLFMESDQLIQISISNATTNLYVPAKVLVLSDGDFEQVWIKNTSLTVEANVWIGAVD